MTPYEQLVIELTSRSFAYQTAYRNGGTSYDLSNRESAAYKQEIETFTRMIEEADCVLVGGASGLSAAGGGDFYYEDNASFRKHFGKFAERYGFKGAFEGSFYRWPTAETRWAILRRSSTPRSTPLCASPTRTSTPFFAIRTFSCSPPTRTRSS